MRNDIIEITSFVPGEYPLIEHGIRNGERLQDARRVLPDAVPYRHEAVLRIEHTVNHVLTHLHFLFEVIFLPRSLVQ